LESAPARRANGGRLSGTEARHAPLSKGLRVGTRSIVSGAFRKRKTASYVRYSARPNACPPFFNHHSPIDIGLRREPTTRLSMEVAMKGTLKALLVSVGVALAGNAVAQVTLFQDDGFQGRRFSANGPVENFADRGFNDEASSARVRGGAWQVCTDAHFRGQCVTLRPGDYPSIGSLGLNDKISSIRPLEQYGQGDERSYDDRGRHAERAWDRSYDDGYGDRDYQRRSDRDYGGYRQ
jgi:hypothetical protein